MPSPRSPEKVGQGILLIFLVVGVLLLLHRLFGGADARKDHFGEDPRNYALQSLARLDHKTFLSNIPADKIMNDWDHNYIANLQGWHGWRMPRYPHEANTPYASHPLDEDGEDFDDDASRLESERIPGEYPNSPLASTSEWGREDQREPPAFACPPSNLQEEPKLPNRENMKFLDSPNLRYAPHYFYTLPYSYSEGGAYPPYMNTRYSQWQPGFDTAGWSWTLRPGMSYNKWPRNRWVNSNGKYFHIDNGTDRAKDYDYA